MDLFGIIYNISRVADYFNSHVALIERTNELIIMAVILQMFDKSEPGELHLERKGITTNMDREDLNARSRITVLNVCFTFQRQQLISF